MKMKIALRAALLSAAIAVMAVASAPGRAAGLEVSEPPYFSGQRASAAGFTEPALDYLTGLTVFLLTPNGAPLRRPQTRRRRMPCIRCIIR